MRSPAEQLLFLPGQHAEIAYGAWRAQVGSFAAKWFAGRITAIHEMDGTCDIEFDDGDSEA